MADAGRHPNIRILTNTEVVDIEGRPGAFTVTLQKHPRFVEEDLCTGCRTCQSFCPVLMPNPFDEGLGEARAISVWCPQAVPAVAYVERERCLHFQGKCGICLTVCKNNAVNFQQKRKRGKVNVGAIVITAGYEVFKPLKGPYGYGEFKNVVTSIEYERITNSTGPTGGEILRRSDYRVPHKIAWIQCVGSRDLKFGRSYCSAFCCTYAIKQALVTKDHHPNIETVIFHNDIRTFGKGFEDLFNRALSRGVRFVRSRPPLLRENPENGNIIVSYVDQDRLIREEFDMVVLSVGVVPAPGNRDLGRILGLEVNEHGFFEIPPFYPLEGADGKGIYVGGNSVFPMDIPDTICSSGAAAASAAELLASQRGSLAVKKQYPPERSVEGEEPRIGVFVCHCGTNIAGVVDVREVVQYVRGLKGVVYAENQLISCSNEGLRRITDLIKERGLNRVVVAACTPRTHEQIFREALREAGLNPYLLEMVNIREHCSWVHSMDKKEATEKAKELLRMAVSRARDLAPLKEPSLKVNPRALVLGGGLAGMTASLSLARQGFEVYLVERERELGGNLRHLHYTLGGGDPQKLLQNLRQRVEDEERIKLYLGYELSDFSGYVGNFKSVLVPVGGDGDQVEIEHGALIIATGGKPLEPSEYHYGESERVLTQLELERMIATTGIPEGIRTVVMIQCVESRNEKRPYCSRICCGEAVKNGLKLKEMRPDLKVVVLYRDMRTYGFLEDYYRKAREKGVLFLPYDPERKPEVELEGDGFKVRWWMPTLGQDFELVADLLVLSVPVVPDGNRELAQRLGLPSTGEGFFMEAHPKLRPVDFGTDGIFLCGMAHYPKYISETIAQAKTAALRAAVLLSQEEIRGSGAVCEVIEGLCIGCGACVEACAYGAIRLIEVKGGKKAQVNPVLCRGDGLCSARCPTGAIRLNHFTDEQIMDQVDALFEA